MPEILQYADAVLTGGTFLLLLHVAFKAGKWTLLVEKHSEHLARHDEEIEAIQNNYLNDLKEQRPSRWPQHGRRS